MTVNDADELGREVDKARARGIDRDPRAAIQWAHALLGEGLMMTTAFGKSGMVILDMVKDLAPHLPVYFLDTGFHFPETLQYVELLRREMGVNLILQRPVLYGDAFRSQYGNLYEVDPDQCCHKNKVEPMAALMERYRGWIAGVRRDQGATRSAAEGIELLETGKLKVQPLVHWTLAETDAYLTERKIPLHPLFSQGYTSIGCAPCTSPNSNTSDERAGRWMGKGKKECGLHTFWKKGAGANATPAEFIGKLPPPSETQAPAEAPGKG